jgi:hypothetical protein
LQSVIPLPASAENLQENFSYRLNKGPSTNGLAGRAGRRPLRVAIVDGFGIADVLILVLDIVAGRQDFVFIYTEYAVASIAMTRPRPEMRGASKGAPRFSAG